MRNAISPREAVSTMLGTKEQIETAVALDAGKNCEMPTHRVDGNLGKHHTDSGPLWLLEIRSPCCNQSVRWAVCDKVHTVLLSYLDANKEWRYQCRTCGREMSFAEAYKGSVKWE